MKKLTNKEQLWLERKAKEDEFFKSLFSHYKLKGFLTNDQYYWLNLFIKSSDTIESDTNKSQMNPTLRKIPCPHCSFLCSTQIKYCSKCGEPLPKLENNYEKNSSLGIIEENYLEKNVIHAIERFTNKEIPCKECFEVSSRCYVREEDQVIAMNLYKSGLTSFPKELLKITSLKYLALRRNSISTLLKEIGFMSNLIYLDLRLNKLQKVPESIGLLTNLKTLNLSSNQIMELPDSIGNLSSLEVLNLNNNRLKNIPTSILNLNSLEKLKLKGNFWISNQDVIDELKQKGIEVIK